MRTDRHADPQGGGVRLVAVSVALLSLLPPLSGAAFAFDRGADGEFERRTSSHFVLYQDVDIDETSGLRGSRRFEQDVLEVLESAYDEADVRLGLRPDGPIVVVVYDPAIFDARFRGAFRFPVAGFYGGRVHVRGDTIVGPHLSRVLHHEFVHAAFDGEIGGRRLPAWLNEGVAEWFESRTTGQRGLPPQAWQALARAAGQGALFGLGDLSSATFGGFGPDSVGLAYLQSHAFIDHLVSLRGERALRDWIREIVRTGNVERATRRTFKRDLDRLYGDHLAALAAR